MAQCVETYVDQVEQIAITIELILDQIKLESAGGNSGNVQESTTDLEQALVKLEQKIAEREELLRDPDAPVQVQRWLKNLPERAVIRTRNSPADASR